MALNDFTGQNIQDTYKKLVQTEGNLFADGTGSILQIITSDQTSSMTVATASFAISASHEITYELSSSYAEIAEALIPGIDIDVRNITASGNISSSGIITAADGTNNGFHIGTGEVALDANLNNLRLGVDDTWTGIAIGKGNDPTKTISLHGPVTASGHISASGEVITNTLRLTPGANDYILSSGTSVNIKSADSSINLISNVTASGNISSSGDVYGTNISASETITGLSGSFSNLAYGGTDLSVSATELNYWDGLTSAEATQVKNIDSNTISGTQWGYLGTMNQNVSTQSTVQFIGLQITKSTIFSGSFLDGEISIGASKGFILSIADVPVIPEQASSPNLVISDNSRISDNSVIIGTSVNVDLIVDTFSVVNGGFTLRLRNPRSGNYSGGSIKINIVVL